MEAGAAPVAVVTGAASGIGAATALALADSGCSVALRDIADLSDVLGRMEATEAGVLAAEVDVGDPASVREGLEITIRSIGSRLQFSQLLAS